ncbi:hypothetical protein [Vibrio parahaemolyticus]|uniref:hypothetical protein n=1 Tax=Vibrio TaxID=662 RepID=UPI001110C8BF|nr:hypothetical protein [Vibrio parahaemolyticus]MDF4881336.1 hypothetical protein [Vibrio parahaemolyticus]MDF5393184.1 hypothetical protein [Vibrio parahaemolyticus]MDF5399106.1 hypothetical protein [Vibrio parahaemolyticus]QRH13524.1 hypothetical protein JCT84_03615 [Vibrio parahaemolyticus]HBC3597867.1 hypothetical protein [Vibrio parahaemolyticus]
MGLGQLAGEIKKLIILGEKTEQMMKEITLISGKIDAYDKTHKLEINSLRDKHDKVNERLIRIEALVEFTQSKYTNTPKVNGTQLPPSQD